MRRVLVIGCSGAGKSTVSRRLAKITGLPLIDLDAIHWRSGWVEPSPREWREIVGAAAAKPEWIMDGNYAGTFDLRVPRADTVVWLDFSRRICLWRVVKRTARNLGNNREGLPPGCPERLNWEFLRYIWTFNAEHRPRVVATLDRFGAGSRVIRLDNDRSVDAFLATVIETPCPSSPPGAG